MLYELTVHAPRVLSHAVLLRRVWGPERVGQAWLVRNVIKRLRNKLGDDAAETPGISSPSHASATGWRRAKCLRLRRGEGKCPYPPWQPLVRRDGKQSRSRVPARIQSERFLIVSSLVISVPGDACLISSHQSSRRCADVDAGVAVDPPDGNVEAPVTQELTMSAI